MPIRFLCPNCRQLLSIGRRKAGTVVACPTCQRKVTVPTPGEGGPQARVFEDLDFDEFLTAPGGPLSDAPDTSAAPVGLLVAAGDADQLPKIQPRRRPAPPRGDPAKPSLPPPEQRPIPPPKTPAPASPAAEAEPAFDETDEDADLSAVELVDRPSRPPEPAEAESDIEELDESDLLPEPAAPAAAPAPRSTAVPSPPPAAPVPTPPTPAPPPATAYAPRPVYAPAPGVPLPAPPPVPEIVYVRQSSRGLIILVTVLTVLIAFAVGGGVGYYVLRPMLEPAAAPGPAAAPAAPDQGLKASVVGTVTYLSDEAPDPRPDTGSCVMVLPRDSRPARKISQLGLSMEFNFAADVGATDDEAAGVVGVRELGGQVAWVDARGDYHLTGLAPGQYWVLILSKQTVQPPDFRAPNETLDTLAEYFDSPKLLLGSHKFVLKPIELKEREILRLPQHFGRSKMP